MTDNVAITAGTGTTIATDDISGVHYQRVKLVDGTLDGTGAIGGDATNGLDVDVTRVPADPFGANADSASATGSISAKLRFIAATGIPVTSVPSHAVTNAGTFAVQESTRAAATTYNATTGDGAPVGALAATAQVIKNGAGTLLGYYIYNPNTVAIYVQFYNATSATVGTTNSIFVLCIPPTAAANLWMTDGVAFSTGITFGAATTGGGNGAPTTALEAVVWYK